MSQKEKSLQHLTGLKGIRKRILVHFWEKHLNIASLTSFLNQMQFSQVHIELEMLVTDLSTVIDKSPYLFFFQFQDAFW